VEHVRDAYPIGHQTARDGELGESARRQTPLQREIGDRLSLGNQHVIVEDHERADASCGHRRKRAFELGGAAHGELRKLQL